MTENMNEESTTHIVRDVMAEWGVESGFTREVLWYGSTHDNYRAERSEWTHVVIPRTSWGDYSGSTQERSNKRCLLRDFPGVFDDCGGSHGSEWLEIATDAVVSSEVHSAMLWMNEMGYYDDSDVSDLEMEMMTEAWDDFWSREFSSEIDTQIRKIIGGEYTDYEPVQTYLQECIDADTLRTWFFEPYSGDCEYYPYAESATDMVFPEWMANAARVAQIIIDRYAQEWEDYAQQITTAEYLSKCTAVLF